MPNATRIPENYVPETLEVILEDYREKERAARAERNEGAAAGDNEANPNDVLEEMNLPPSLMRR